MEQVPGIRVSGTRTVKINSVEWPLRVGHYQTHSFETHE